MAIGSSNKATRRRWLRLVVIGALAVTTTAAVPSTSGAQEAPPPPPAVRPDKATADGALRGRDPAPKPAESTVPPGYSSSALRLKFREGTGVRLRGGRFLSSSGADVSAVEDVLAGVTGLRRDRLMAAPEQEVANATALAERRSGRRQADLNLYYRLQVAPGTDAPALLDALNALDVVELAYAEPLPVPPPSPSFVSMQGYRGGAPAGIGVDQVGGVAGSRGGRVKVVDLEYNWNVTHEDLAKAGVSGAFIPNGTFHDPFNNTDHGTAVLGELTGDPDAQGVTGLVPDAAIGFVNQSNVERGAGDIANAIYAAVQRMSPGDVLLVEAQVPGANGGCGQDQVGCVAVEWLPDIYDAVVFATSSGIIVVEAAGNGNQNLDAANYGNPFPRGRRDSGAIIVGAGGAPNCATNSSGPRARATFSTYGRRVNLQGWGECVTTTGYGHLQGGSDRNAWYTGTFGGTSSASPIVAGAAAALSSAFEQGTGSTMLSWQARSRLRATGTAQDTSVAGQIGPLPDLTRALTQPMTAPANDRFANATVIGGTTGATRTTTGRNLWSSFEGGEPFHAGIRGGSTSWFTWVAPATGTAAIDTFGSNFDTVLAVYQGNSVSALTPRASNDDFSTSIQSAVSLPVTEGTTYRIAVDGFDGAMGNITLHTGVPGAPVANAGPDASAAANAAFFLDASNSTDPQGNPLTFAWTRLSGPAVVIETPNAARTRVSGNHANGTVMTFRVTVSDNAGNRDSDTVTITTGSSK